MKITALILLVVFVILSCKKSNLTNCENIKIYSNEEYNSKTVSLDYSKNSLDHLFIINETLQQKCCWTDCSFGLMLSNDEIYKVYINERCVGKVVCGIHSEVDVLINRNGQILYGGEFSNTKKIISQRTDEEYSKWKTHGFEISWDSGVPMDTLNNVFFGIEEKYKTAWDKRSIELFNAKFCSLDPMKADSVVKEIPFKIQLSVNHWGPPLEIIEE